MARDPTISTIDEWLDSLGLTQYLEAFQREAVVPTMLRYLTEDRLERLGVKLMGHRILMLESIARIRWPEQASSRAPGFPLVYGEEADDATPVAAAVVEEVKNATVLFADIKGSTRYAMRLAQGRGPDVLDPVVARMEEAVQHFEGVVHEWGGDGLTALFGAPMAISGHAQKACFAALRMQDSIRDYSMNLKRNGFAMIEVRVGVHSGEILLRPMRNKPNPHVYGQTTIIGKRLEEKAAPGTILISEETRTLAGPYIRVNPLGAKRLKDLPPREVYELHGVGNVTNQIQVAALRGFTPFVGRNAEMDRLAHILDDAGRSYGQIVTIFGEAGVGKSRLVYEFINSMHAQGWRTLSAASVSYGKASSFMPIVTLLGNYFGIGEREDLLFVEERVKGKVLVLDESLASIIPPLLAMLDIPIKDEKWQMLEPIRRRQLMLHAVRHLLLRESVRQPLLLVFEDLHWFDPDSLALLDSLVDAIKTERILILTNYRSQSGFRPRWEDRCERISLAPLSGQSAIDILEALLGNDASLEGVRARLMDRGNPFYLEELVRDLAEKGYLQGSLGDYRLARPLDSLEVPESVSSTLMERIDRLPAAQKQVLHCAAVIGKNVPEILLAAIAPVATEELQSILFHLQSGGFIYEAQVFPDEIYSFKHSLTHEVALRELPQARKKSLNADLVAAVETHYRGRLPEHVNLLAEYAWRGEMWDKAVEYSLKAGKRGIDRSVARESLAHFDRARRALDNSAKGPERTRKLVELCLERRNALFPMGEFKDVGLALDEAALHARALGDQVLLARVLAYQGHYSTFMGRHDEAFKALDQTRASLQQRRFAGDTMLALLLNYYQGQASWFKGDIRNALEPLSNALPLVKQLPDNERLGMTGLPGVIIRWAKAQVLSELGEFPQATDVGLEGLELAKARGHRFSEVWARYGLGYAQMRQGEYSASIHTLEPALQSCKEMEMRVAHPFVCATLGISYVSHGRLGDGLQMLQEADAYFDATGSSGMRPLFAAHRAYAQMRVAMTNGDLEQMRSAEACCREAIKKACERNEEGWEAWSLKLLADILSLKDGELDAAEQNYEDAMSRAKSLGMQPLVAHCLLGRGRLSLRSGREALGQEQRSEAASLFGGMNMYHWQRESEAGLKSGS